MIPVFTVITRVNPDADEQAVTRDEQDLAQSTGMRPRDKGETLLTPKEVTVYSLIGLGGFVLALIIVALWLRTKTRGTVTFLHDQEQLFERDMLKEFGPMGRQGGHVQAASASNGDDQPISPGAQSAKREIDTIQPVVMGAGADAGVGAGSAAGAAAALEASTARSAFDAQTEDVCRRLETAGLLQSREGPLMLSDSDSRGLMVRLRGDKLALILGDWESEKFYRRQFKRFEVIFIARGDGEVTVMQPMGRYLGDRVSL